jgi:hypothetical protein
MVRLPMISGPLPNDPTGACRPCPQSECKLNAKLLGRQRITAHMGKLSISLHVIERNGRAVTGMPLEHRSRDYRRHSSWQRHKALNAGNIPRIFRSELKKTLLQSGLIG